MFSFSNVSVADIKKEIRKPDPRRARISPYSVRMQENADQNNSEYGHFLGSAIFAKIHHKRLAKS